MTKSAIWWWIKVVLGAIGLASAMGIWLGFSLTIYMDYGSYYFWISNISGAILLLVAYMVGYERAWRKSSDNFGNVIDDLTNLLRNRERFVNSN